MSLQDKTTHAIRYWLLRRLPTCKDTTRVISEGMERTLTIREKALLRLHLWVCSWCQWYMEQLYLLRKTMREPVSEDLRASSASLSPEARERIKQKLSSS